MDFTEDWPYFIRLFIVIAQETDCILLLQGFRKGAFCNLLIVNEHYETHLIYIFDDYTALLQIDFATTHPFSLSAEKIMKFIYLYISIFEMFAVFQ